MHEHHKKMQSQGGGDEDTNLAFLCPTCHNSVHIIAKKSAANLPTAHLFSVWTNPKSLARAKELVAEILKHEILAVRDSNAGRKITIVLDSENYQKLQLIARTYLKPSGKRHSITSAATTLLIKGINDKR